MSFKYYSVDNAIWEDYFMRQVKNNASDKKPFQAVVHNGINSENDHSKLSIVGKFYNNNNNNNNNSVTNDPVIVNMTSPASVTVEMAKSEIENIKEQERNNSITTSPPLKRKRGNSGKKRQAVKRKYNSKHQDIFS